MRTPLLFFYMALVMLGLAALSLWNPERALEIHAAIDEAE